jgi:hypothetical protein
MPALRPSSLTTLRWRFSDLPTVPPWGALTSAFGCAGYSGGRLSAV